MNTELRHALEQVARRFRLARLWSSLALCWLAWGVIGLGLASALGRAPSASANRWLPLVFVTLAALTGAYCALLVHRSLRDRRWIARKIEANHPDLDTGLLAAVEEDARALPGKLGFLQSVVIRQALDHHATHDWEAALPGAKLLAAQIAHAASLGFLFLASLLLVDRTYFHASGQKPAGFADASGLGLKVEPGNAALERGTALLVVARFGGTVPPDATLVLRDATGAETRTPMARSLEDPTFAARVASVGADLDYRVEYQEQKSATYHVNVFEYPALQRADARLVFPGYTALPPKTVEDVRHVTAVEGTDLSLLFRLNKDVASARLLDETGEAIALEPRRDGKNPHVYGAAFKLVDGKRYKVQLIDRDGRANKIAADLVVNVVRNKPPTVKVTRPGRDTRVSPVEELALEAQIEDDFGVVRHGLSYAIAGEGPREITLTAAEKTTRKLSAKHLLDFESLHAQPDQLVTYFFWAEDVGADETPRRASGDMFFAEVRHFEEIFRQGEQPTNDSAENEEQQQQGNAQQAEKLAELQKEIINGTWKVLRRETSAKPTNAYAGDVTLLAESQASAIEQADAMTEKLTDATSKASLEQAVKFMRDARTRLTEAAEKPPARLSPALVPEQAAYQALLKLRAREFEVVRNNSRQRSRSSQAGGSPSQRQLDQLQLSNDENRYEDQRTAKAQEAATKREQEQRETRQVMNRLKELAQRQTDLNDRVKELQSALEAARTDEARAEIERQLKRLRDQQQEVLRDTDELRERMEREENRDRMADARQQVEQGRENVRQANEALQQGRLPQAVNEGARAEKQLNEVREQLRKESSDRFSQQLTEMRAQARGLDEQQKKVSDQLDAWNNDIKKTLRDDPTRKQMRENLDQQGKQLGNLIDRMQTTVQDAEETEPLLAKQLYNAARKAGEKAIPESLKETGMLVDAGVPEEAVKSSRQAAEGIEQLREGVERAAESVLGDETAALKRAQHELDELANQLNREIDQATNREAEGADAARGQSKTAEGQDSRRTEEQKSKTAEEQKSKRAGEQKGKAAGEQKGRTSGEQTGKAAGEQKGRTSGEQTGGTGGEQGGLRAGQQGQRPGGGNPSSDLDRLMNGGPSGPITGEDFRQWSDRLRDVEELLEDPAMRAEAARIRDRARGAREAFTRHATEPDWTRLKGMVADPIRELRDRVAEEVHRREKPDSLVPIDRDPVPPRYSDNVKRYYERLGSGR